MFKGLIFSVHIRGLGHIEKGAYWGECNLVRLAMLSGVDLGIALGLCSLELLDYRATQFC